MKNQPIQHFILQVKIVTSALDPEINEKFYVIPGIGNFGDRYFGTEPSYEIFDWNNAHISAFTGLYPDHRISTCLDWCVCRSADPNLHTHGVIPTESIFNLFYTNTSFEWCAIPCIELAMMIVSLFWFVRYSVWKSLLEIVYFLSYLIECVMNAENGMKTSTNYWC